jgi:hypothetical protein
VPEPESPRECAPDLRDAVAEALSGMTWLEPSDEGLKALALRQAQEIEKAIDRAEELTQILRDAAGDPDIYKRVEKLQAMCDVTKVVGWLGPQLQGVLRDLGGTPKGRKDLSEGKKLGGRLAQLRADAANAAGLDDT